MQDLIKQIKENPETVEFQQVMDVIAAQYIYKATDFSNGIAADLITNAAGTNEGSCKIFAFAWIHQLTEAQTLACFGHYYREDVLQNPDGTDHLNIRIFMRFGWDGVAFCGNALVKL